MDDVLVGSRLFVVAAFLFFCVRATQYHSRWYQGAGTTIHTWVDVEFRVVGQHVAVNMKNHNRPRVHNLGPQQKVDFPSLDWCSFRWIGFHSWGGAGLFGQNQNVGLPEQLGWLDSWKMLWNWCPWAIPCLSSGAWAAVLPRLVAKPCERGFLFARIAWCLTMRRITGRSFGTVGERAGGRRGSRNRRVSSVEKALRGPPALLGECGE